jgi:pilus assembly protein Flp/PilA
MLELMRNFWTDESGQDLAEYALLIALISIALIVAIGVFREEISGIFERIGDTLSEHGDG